jgi:hypothetical protein
MDNINNIGLAIAAHNAVITDLENMHNDRLRGLILRTKGEMRGMLNALVCLGYEFRWTDTERKSWAIVPRD